MVQRLTLLAETFAIDVAAYAVMSNHYHVVLHIHTAKARSFTNEDVIRRWKQLYKGPECAQRYIDGKPLSKVETRLLSHLVKRWRKRLCSISWFMRSLNEHLARKANAEDDCKGRFWEGRFKSKALLDETALLSCMAYVDLNPIRAGITDSVEDANFTSIQARIRQAQQMSDEDGSEDDQSMRLTPRLMPFAEPLRESPTRNGIPFGLQDYLTLTECTGRVSRGDTKEDSADLGVPALLSTLGLSVDEWELLALRVQKQSITMLHGMDRIISLRNRRRGRRAG